MKFLKTLVIMMLAAGCAVQSSGQADRGQPQPQPSAGAPAPSNKKVDPAVVERLQRVMIPLMAKMNRPPQPNQVKGSWTIPTSTRPAPVAASST
jgi:hypothetical protein